MTSSQSLIESSIPLNFANTIIYLKAVIVQSIFGVTDLDLAFLKITAQKDRATRAMLAPNFEMEK